MGMMHAFVDDKIGKALDKNKGMPIVREDGAYSGRMSSPGPHLVFNTPVEIGLKIDNKSANELTESLMSSPIQSYQGPLSCVSNSQVIKGSKQQSP